MAAGSQAAKEAAAWRSVALNFLVETVESAHAQDPNHPRAKFARGVKAILNGELPETTDDAGEESVTKRREWSPEQRAAAAERMRKVREAKTGKAAEAVE